VTIASHVESDMTVVNKSTRLGAYVGVEKGAL